METSIGTMLCACAAVGLVAGLFWRWPALLILSVVLVPAVLATGLWREAGVSVLLLEAIGAVAALQAGFFAAVLARAILIARHRRRDRQ